jgi:predicted negative regulator of RcsB-dependent stress response
MDSAQPEHKESFGLLEMLAWAEVNRKPLLIGTIVAVAAVVCSGVYRWNQDRVETEANTALSAVPSLLGTGAEGAKEDPAAFLKVAADFPGTSSGQRAAVLAGAAEFNTGKFADAQATFAKFLADHPDSPLASQAAVGVACSLDAQGKADEALAKYQELIRGGANQSGLTEIKLNEARIYEKQNKPEQAMAIYASLGAVPTRSLWSAEVEERQRQLLLQHPELAKPAATNAVPSPAMMPKIKP